MNHPSNRAERLRLKKQYEEKNKTSKAGNKRAIKERLKEAEADSELRSAFD